MDVHRDGPPALDRVQRDVHRQCSVPHSEPGHRHNLTGDLHCRVRGFSGDRGGAAGEIRQRRAAARRSSAGCRRRHLRLRVLTGGVLGMQLVTVWFCLIAVLWVGYFVLEGFDFGVGALLPVLGRDNTDRRILINTIGPLWDGNEVWVIVAGGATFAAFPEWYATLFSGFYLPLLLILLALIIRGLAFEYRGKIDDERWRRRWDAAIVVGSVLPSVLWGVAFANIVAGVPIDARHQFT